MSIATDGLPVLLGTKNMNNLLKRGYVFQLEYSLKAKEKTKFTTDLGYFHDMHMLIVAASVEEAVYTLTLHHDDGAPEGIKATQLGPCIFFQSEPE